MSRGRTFWQKVKKQRVRSLSPRGPVIYERGGMAGANRGGRVITFNATKNGRVTKNLSLVWGRVRRFWNT